MSLDWVSNFYIDNVAGIHVPTPAWTSSIQGGAPWCNYGITYPGGGDIVLHE